MSLEDFAVECGDARYALPYAFLAFLSTSDSVAWCDFSSDGRFVTAFPKKGKKPPITQKDIEITVKVMEEYGFLTLKELRALVKSLIRGVEGRITRGNVHAFVKPPYLPPFRLIQNKELVRWSQKLARLQVEGLKAQFEQDASNLLNSEVRLIFKDASKRAKADGLFQAVTDKLSDGADALDIPSGLWKPVTLVLRDLAWRFALQALSHGGGDDIEVSLDAFLVLVQKCLGLKDWADAVEGFVSVSAPALDYLSCLAPLDSQRLSKLACGYEGITVKGYAKVRKRLFDEIGLLMRM